MVSYSVSSVDSPPWLGRTASVKWVQQVHSDGNDGDGVPASKSWGKRQDARQTACEVAVSWRSRPSRWCCGASGKNRRRVCVMGTPDGASSACHRLAVGQSLPEARLSGGGGWLWAGLVRGPRGRLHKSGAIMQVCITKEARRKRPGQDEGLEVDQATTANNR